MQINQLPAAASLNLQDKFAVDATDGVTKSITAAKLRDLVRANSYGAPLEASTVAAMTDTSKVYVYTGNETGYTNGNWYYYDGTAWVSGGVYNSVAVNTDTTLTLSGVAADARATGTAIQGVATQVTTVEGDLQQEIDNILSDLAPDYDTNLLFPVSEGQYCVRAERFYKANQDIPTSEAWNSAHWDMVKIGNELYGVGEGIESAVAAEATAREQAIAAEATAREAADDELNESLSNEVLPYNAVDALYVSGTPQNGTVNGVTYTFFGNKCTAIGTVSSSTPSYRNIFASKNSFPYGIKAGKKIYVKANSTDSNLSLTIFFYKPNGSLYSGIYIYSDAVVDVPSDAVGMIARINVPGNKTVNGSVEYAILTTLTNAELEAKASSLICAKDVTPYVSNNTVTLSDITEDGFYVISTSYTVTDAPTGQRVTGLTVEHFSTVNVSGFVKQTVEDIISPSTSKIYYRFSNSAGASWSEWVELTGASYTNEYTFEEYFQTVNLTASPQITSDTNNYLAPTGDSTDRTADILAMLTSNKICRLGTGDYYVSGLQMPNNSALIGSGSSTVIHLIDSSDGYAIKPSNYCILSDFTVDGGTPGTFGETIGNRHGILWQGNYTESQTAPMMCRMNNILIRNFSGGGITCYDTGYGTFNVIEATNIVVLNCWAGINISYWSEFHKFTNVRCYSCRVGCVNNGGSNIFVNCDFSKSKEICMLMDNSQSQSPNNSHGSCIGCVFNHADSGGVANSGIGIKMLNCDNGFIFSGCQIFYAKVELVDSDGVCFTNCNFGYSNCNISVSGGKAILFSGNIHQDTPPITISNNADVHFVNCYNRTTGAVVEPS